MANMQLDICYASYDSFEEGMHALYERVQLPGTYFKVINPNGPGGGWPVVKFSGPRQELEAICDDYVRASHLKGKDDNGNWVEDTVAEAADAAMFKAAIEG